MGQVLLYPGSVCSVCTGPASIWYLLGCQFFRLFVMNCVSFLNWTMMLVFSVEVLCKSGSQTSLLVSPFSGANSSTVAEFHLTCDPTWDSFLFGTCPDSALLSAGSSRSSCCSDPKGHSFGDTFTCFRCSMLGQNISWHTCIKKKVTYFLCWFYCYYRVFVFRLKYQLYSNIQVFPVDYV